ncbi:MAG: hypothetical protein B6226_01765 [Candidatus Cloacimonetes bacterium 4572_65]|nr:MAG: hypothetical protein B6226_01765 [Candidatus Cloacimonetes bacterium 4572_65]
MAKLFRNEYNKHANAWYFKDTVIKTKSGDLLYWKSLDENGLYNFRFFAESSLKKHFPGVVTIQYDHQLDEIVSHYCSEDLDRSCNHYLTVVDYAYKYILDDIIQEEIIEVYNRDDLRFNEYFQRLYTNTYITISDVFKESTDKIRIHFNGYSEFDLRIISTLKADKEVKNSYPKELIKARNQMNIFREEELVLLSLLHLYKCSFSKKNNFFSLYKRDFFRVLSQLAILKEKVYIQETGDKISFSKDKFPIHFTITKLDKDNYLLKGNPEKEISAIFYYNTIIAFVRSEIYSFSLPFKTEIIQEIFKTGCTLSTKDMVYYHAIVAKQLALSGYYLDLDDDIELPLIYDKHPKLYFKLRKDNDTVLMDGRLVYSENVSLPLSMIRFQSNLISYKDELGDKAWYYIPPVIFKEVFSFLDQLPSPQFHRLETDSQIVFEGALSIDLLKKAIFEMSSENWNIELSDDLKKDFIYKVHLKAEVTTKSSEDIDWFQYNVVYKYKDFSFSHAELQKFFKSKQKYMTLEDGRIIFFENKEIFNEMEQLLSHSENSKNKVYKMNLESIPYFFKLVNNNPAIKLNGDKFINSMSHDLIAGKLKNAPTVPPFLMPIMRSYQKSGYQWMKMLAHYGLNGILADEMGLGKTIQAISILSDIPAGEKSVIICPKTLIFNWAAEFKKFKLNKAFIIYEGSKLERMQLLKSVNFDILIASYSIIQNDIKELMNYKFNYVILDEAQHIKNVSALRTKAIKKLKSKHRLALTGTPLENEISEIWSLFDFLLPNYLMSRQRFIRAFGGNENREQREELHKMISPFILRRKKSDVLIELPNKQEQIAFCKLAPIQEKVYMQLIENVNNSYFNPERDEKINYINILTALMRLRQICDHPQLVEGDLKADVELSGKVALLQELILDAIDSGRKILVFSQFIGMLKIAKDMLKKHRIPYEYLDGKTKNREQHIDNFNNNTSIKVFLISLKTGGYGLNLTSADTVILVDPWWNPMIENQAIDRTHRIGQTRKVQVYKLIAKGTVEEKILSLQKSKTELFEQIIENSDNILKTMSIDQIKELFHYEA